MNTQYRVVPVVQPAVGESEVSLWYIRIPDAPLPDPEDSPAEYEYAGSICEVARLLEKPGASIAEEYVTYAHVARLQAEMERLEILIGQIQQLRLVTEGELAESQSELAKARELLRQADDWLPVLRQHGYHQTRTLSGRIDEFLADHSAPAAEDQS